MYSLSSCWNSHRHTDGRAMLREIRELMDHFSANRPICFILEDMHWSDLGTLRMMEYFARRPRPVPILWIASFRLAQIIAENHPLRALRQELKVQRLCEEIVLDPFSEAEVAAYLETRLPGAEFPHSFIKRLHEHTDGLPLFVASVADTLVEHVQADKVLIFKKKRRHNYRRKRGHRQGLSVLKVTEIVTGAKE